jgi:hypothetical protein
VLYINLLKVYGHNEGNVDRTRHVRYLFQNISSHPQSGHAFPVERDIIKGDLQDFSLKQNEELDPCERNATWKDDPYQRDQQKCERSVSFYTDKRKVR